MKEVWRLLRAHRELRGTILPSRLLALNGFRSKFPALDKKFPARSLLGRKKLPAPPRRELSRKRLEYLVFFGQNSVLSRKLPANSLLAGNFSLLPPRRPR